MTVTINQPAPAQSGISMVVSGTIYPYTDSVNVGLSQSATVPPAAYVMTNGNAGGLWSLSLTPTFSGSVFVWAQQLTPAQVKLSLRWSLDKGKTFGNRVYQSIGAQGQYITAPSWRRIGIGRDVVFELEWSFNGFTALNGAFLDFAVMKT